MQKQTHALGLRLFLALLITSFSALIGCKSYQLGSPTELPFNSIYVGPVGNQSLAPQAQALLSSQIRDSFIRDGRLKLVTKEDDADSVLLVTLTKYNREAAARDRDDTTVARDFDLYLTADISLFNQNKGDHYFESRTITQRSSAYAKNPYLNSTATDPQGLLQAEYQAMPRMTRDLARKIANEVLSPWEPK